ncbi:MULTISPECIES: hypothetical protein [Clostridia]|uniref:Lipoprotein n=1 Tax=Lacrimispora xylanolytica TaxID=29375 RepID=A0ABY7A759_9FIRM|nr:MULTISPECIES: hypothetical protein [Clostridia]WAJ22505.1 hypothetical protein OW255_13075 [Lacrimispora xylanolytica]
MNRLIVYILAAFMVAAALTSCRHSYRKQIRPLFSQISCENVNL